MKRRWRKIGPKAMVVLSMLLAGCSSTSPESPGCQEPEDGEALVDLLYDQVQSERDKKGLPPLVLNDRLCAAAEQHACAMIDGGFFAHIDPETDSSPGQRAYEKGYAYLSIGENLAAGQQSVEEVVEQWMDSPGHQANILGPNWRATGIAVRAGGEYGMYWIQLFADPVDFGELEPLGVAAFSP